MMYNRARSSILEQFHLPLCRSEIIKSSVYPSLQWMRTYIIVIIGIENWVFSFLCEFWITSTILSSCWLRNSFSQRNNQVFSNWRSFFTLSSRIHYKHPIWAKNCKSIFGQQLWHYLPPYIRWILPNSIFTWIQYCWGFGGGFLFVWKMVSFISIVFCLSIG